MLILRLVACVTCVSGRCSAKEYIVCEMVIWVGVVIEVERGGEGREGLSLMVVLPVASPQVSIGWRSAEEEQPTLCCARTTR